VVIVEILVMNIEPRYHKKDKTYNIRGYIDYANGVLNGKIVAGEYVRLACKRFFEFLERDDMYFDIDTVDKVINLIYKLKHTAGRFNKTPFKLLPWQQFIIANLFGFKWKSNDLRVTRNVFCMVSRKNGKTCLMSAICIAALLVDGNHEAEIDFISNSSKQAGIAFNMTTNFCKSIDPDQKIFKRYRSEIRIPVLSSKIQILSSDSMTLDGYNSSICVLDEMHAMKDWSLYNVMKSSQGAREEPIMCAITTAGFLVGDYPCYSMWENSIAILRGQKQDDTTFSMIFQLDDDDAWDNEQIWKKACPSLGETVYTQYLRDEINAAKNNSSLEVGVRTKNLNMWCQSEDIWLSHDLIKRNMKPFEIEDLHEMGAQELYGGVDLAAVSDLTAISVCAPIEGKYYFKSWTFIPEDCLKEGINHELYFNWRRKKQIEVTEGNVTDYDYIIEKIREVDNIIFIRNILFDNWNSTQWAIDMTELGINCEPFSQSIGNFSRYVKEFQRQLLMGNVVIDDNLVTSFCFDNATLKFDHNDNCKPAKGGAKSGKIDVCISMIQAFAACIIDQGNVFGVTVVD